MVLPFLPFYLYKFDPRAHVCYELRNKNCYKIQDGNERSQKSVTLDFLKIDKKTDRVDFERGYLLTNS